MKLGSPSISEGTQQKDSVLLSFLICCGILGIIASHFFLNLDGQDSFTQILIQPPPTALPDVVPAQIANQKGSIQQENLFVPKDYLEAELMATFTLQNASKDVQYELELDGIRKPFVNGRVNYTFHKHGHTVVKLYGTFGGREKFLQERPYEVARAPEVEKATGLVNL